MSRLFGLVVCGGKSIRMGKDKSLLTYHGKPQRYYIHDLLQTMCDKVFISCNAKQAEEIKAPYEILPDAEKYNNIGPMAALLTAFDAYPDDAFMVIGCDYPFLEKSDLQLLCNTRNMEPMAVSFYNDEFIHHEPLLSIYEPEIKEHLYHNFKEGNYSLKQLLKEVNAYKLLPAAIDIIRSIDTQQEYEAVIELLNLSAQQKTS